MNALPEDMAREIWAHLGAAEKAYLTAVSLLKSPKGHPTEQLEDALNELQDEAFQARRAYRSEAAR